jgi:hypothetical protein
MPPVGFKHTISAGERRQTYALDRAATGNGMEKLLLKQKRWIYEIKGISWKIRYYAACLNKCAYISLLLNIRTRL